MPWSETTKMRERMRFVLDAEEDLFWMTELCERYGISRVTGHKWLLKLSALFSVAFIAAS